MRASPVQSPLQACGASPARGASVDLSSTKRQPPHKAGPTLEILISGACELLFLGVAAHAAVDGANRLAQVDPKGVHFKGLINAVLRRIAREGADVVARQDAERLNTPDWLWTRWLENYGEVRASRHCQSAFCRPGARPYAEARDDPYSDITGALALAPGRLRIEHAGRVEELPVLPKGDGGFRLRSFASRAVAGQRRGCTGDRSLRRAGRQDGSIGRGRRKTSPPLIFHPIGSAESRKTSSGSAFLLSSSPQMRTTGARKHLRAASFWTHPARRRAPFGGIPISLAQSRSRPVPE